MVEKEIVKEWNNNEIKMKIIKIDVFNTENKYYNGYAYYNGYVGFPNKPFIEENYWGLLSYVPVYGGITYFNKEEDGYFWYGFDTAMFCESRSDNLEWVIEETEKLRKYLFIAMKYETNWKKLFDMKKYKESNVIIEEFLNECKNI